MLLRARAVSLSAFGKSNSASVSEVAPPHRSILESLTMSLSSRVSFTYWVNDPVPIVLRQANVRIVEQRNQDERGGLNRQLVPPLGVGHDQRPRERRRVPVEEERMAEGKHIIAPCCLN